MAVILSQRPVIDGYDVRILTGGQAHTLHFTTQPDEAVIANAVLKYEMALIDQIAADLSLEQEEGDVQLFDQ
jgi:hypothetical protein